MELGKPLESWATGLLADRQLEWLMPSVSKLLLLQQHQGRPMIARRIVGILCLELAIQTALFPTLGIAAWTRPLCMNFYLRKSMYSLFLYHRRRKLHICLRKNAFVINVSRGKVLEQGDLIEALKKDSESGGTGGAMAGASGLRGAALDVTDPEPLPADSELWDLENVVVTPHIRYE
jgi:hypothetical protein